MLIGGENSSINYERGNSIDTQPQLFLGKEDLCFPFDHCDPSLCRQSLFNFRLLFVNWCSWRLLFSSILPNLFIWWVIWWRIGKLLLFFLLNLSFQLSLRLGLIFFFFIFSLDEIVVLFKMWWNKRIGSIFQWAVLRKMNFVVFVFAFKTN